MAGDGLEALYRLMLTTGLRRGEALGLHWCDVDLDTAVLRVAGPCRGPPPDWISATGSLWQRTGLVFTTEIGPPLEPRDVLRRFEALAERAGLAGVHLHTLRHPAVSFLLAAGTQTKVVQEYLGHRWYAITADIYSHVGPQQQREAADRLDEALHGDVAVRICAAVETAEAASSCPTTPPLTCAFVCRADRI